MVLNMNIQMNEISYAVEKSTNLHSNRTNTLPHRKIADRRTHRILMPVITSAVWRPAAAGFQEYLLLSQFESLRYFSSSGASRVRPVISRILRSRYLRVLLWICSAWAVSFWFC